MKKINSNSYAATIALSTGAGVGAGLGIISAGVQNAKSVLKDGGFDTFESVAKFTEKYKTTRENGILLTKTKTLGLNELGEIAKKRMSACSKMTSEELTNLANKAFKTTGKTYAKYAAIFGAIGLAIGSAIVLIKNLKQNTNEKQEKVN